MLAGGIVAAIGLFLIGPAHVSAQAAAAAPIDPSEYLYKLGFIFQPASTCSNVKCHGAPKDTVTTDPTSHRSFKTDSYTLESLDDAPNAPADPHHISFKNLLKPRAKAIGTKLNIAKPSADAKCISCHALNPPAALMVPVKAGDPPFKPTDGVSCNACHGPSGKWFGTHDKDFGKPESWAESQSKTLGGDDKLLTTFGFYRTRPLIARAQRCVSCHLAIDPEMVAAGHPQPAFELNWFSLTYPNKHWNDPHDDKDPLAPYFEARLWAAGQVASLQAAYKQLADRAANPKSTAGDITSAYNQAYAHYTVFAPLFKKDGGAVAGDFGPVTNQLIACSKLLAGDRAKLKEEAEKGAAATKALEPAVAAYTPAKATTQAMVSLIAKAQLADATAAFGIEQQRDALFALQDAYAKSTDGDKAAGDLRDAIGQKLFADASGNEVPADKFKPADFKAALAGLGIK